MAEMQEPLVIIQARMGSSRFPGKTMYPFRGKPSLLHLIDSLRQCTPKGELCIVTSRSTKDDPIADLGGREGIRVFRGDEENVASRFVTALEEIRPERFCRVSGDSPLLDWRILAEVKAADDAADIVTTTLEPRFPAGMNVEMVKTGVFLEVFKRFQKAEHFEHVTRYFYEHRTAHRVTQVAYSGPSGVRFSFDTDEDRRNLERIFFALQRPHYEYTLEEKCALYSAARTGAPC